MSPIRRVARPLLASMFIAGGIDALRHPQAKVEQAQKAGLQDADRLVKIEGATDLVAGLTLATGRLPRLSSLVLAGVLVPTTYVGHPFWSEKDKGAKLQQRTQFLKNLGILGGLLISVADTGGRESLPHAASRVAHEQGDKVSSAASKAQKKAAKAQKKASKAQKQALKSASKGAGKAQRKAGKASGVVSAKLSS